MDPLTAGMSLLNTGLNMFGQSQTNQMQQSMMQQQQAFSERMSSTAYQRASQDMKAAGLNPMMMFGSGAAASSPQGAAPSPAIKSGVDSSGIERAISSANALKLADATINNLVEQNAKIKAETLTESVKPDLMFQQAKESAARTATETQKPALVESEAALKRAALPIALNEAARAKSETEFRTTAAGKLLDKAGLAGQKLTEVASPVSSFVGSARQARRLYEGF